MKRSIVFATALGALALGVVVAQDHVDQKKLEKVRESVKAQHAQPKPKATLTKDAGEKLHRFEAKCETALAAEAKLEAATGKAHKEDAKAHKAEGAAHALAKSVEHAKKAEAHGGEKKDAHDKATAAKVKESVAAQKNKPEAKAELEAAEEDAIFSIEVKFELVFEIDAGLDKEEHNGADKVHGLDAEVKKLHALEDRLHQAEADEAAWAKDLLDRVWVEALLKEIHADIDELEALAHDLEVAGLHEAADEIDLCCDELEDLAFDLADEWLLLHSDELKGPQLDAAVVWVASMDEWHEWDARTWQQDLEDTFWFEALIDELHHELDMLEVELHELEADFHDLVVAEETVLFESETILFDIGVDWLEIHVTELDEAQVEHYEVWVVELEPHAV